MIKTNMSGIPGMGAMNDTLDFVKNLWGGMSVPGMGIPGIVMPTLSVEEINKQISDLKAVESWLTLNMNMLRGTIQSLEVQSATISTLQSMGESFSAAVQTGADAVKEHAENASFSAPKPAAVKVPEPAPKPVYVPEPEPEPEPEPAPKAERKAAPKAAKESKGDAKDQSASFMAPQANPAVWWNMLQDQFKQAVSTAMVNDVAKPAAAKASTPAAPAKAAKSKKAPAKRKPAAKKPAAKSTRRA
ncbi:hypothetical protein BH11PSE11_BH11PSE11_28760 [soil metagenome]